MIQISTLKTIKSKYFAWNKARLECFTQMPTAFFIVKTVNLRELAIAFSSKAAIACWVFSLFFVKAKSVYATIDRANWF
ncbi:MAG: family transposase [Gammaproteobacteria bacterium]|jgi:hypothetical protein|nr:family transposase [Gammaproteobacteria bacterium]